MSDAPKKPPQRRKPGAAPRSKGSDSAAARPRRKPHSYGQSAEMPDAPDTNPATVETAKKPVAKAEDDPDA